MKTKLSVALVVFILLSGCTGQVVSKKAHDNCVYGLGMTGAAAGGAAGGFPGIWAGATAGTAVGLVVCGRAGEVEAPTVSPTVSQVVTPTEPTVWDSDGDGVIDERDRCWNTPTGIVVDLAGCGVDGDGDGVPDHRDQCAGTPSGSVVDTTGCTLTRTGGSQFVRVHFDTDSAALKPEAQSTLDIMLATLSLADPDLRFYIVVGHADSRASDAYNDALSMRRARSVIDYLVLQGFPEGRLEAVAKGEHEPIATNANPRGRAQNRRVDIIAE